MPDPVRPPVFRAVAAAGLVLVTCAALVALTGPTMSAPELPRRLQVSTLAQLGVEQWATAPVPLYAEAKQQLQAVLPQPRTVHPQPAQVRLKFTQSAGSTELIRKNVGLFLEKHEVDLVAFRVCGY